MNIHIFCHPQALPHPLTTTPGDFVGYICVYEPKLNQKVVPLTRHTSIEIIFLFHLSLYQMKPLSVEKLYSSSIFQLSLSE